MSSALNHKKRSMRSSHNRIDYGVFQFEVNKNQTRKQLKAMREMKSQVETVDAEVVE